MRKYFSEGKKGKSGKTPTTPREKALAAKYGNKKVITRGDIITAAKEKSGKRTMAMGGGMMRKKFGGGGSDSSKYHTKKDGTKARKGLYYYMNRAKKRGTSKPGKGSVTDKALKRSAKTDKKA